MSFANPRRESLIDALRGGALFGILAVNIQCFSSGLTGASLGVLDAQSAATDRWSVVLIAFFLQYKFYPLFCFCFGYGFALQTRRWRAQGRDAMLRFRRRTDFLLGLGVLHGVLLWFGDILTSYAIAGKVLAAHAGKGPKRLLPVLRFWLVLTLAIAIPVTIVLATDFGAGSALLTSDAQANQRETERVAAIYTRGGFFEALWQRAGDYVLVTLGFLLTGAEVILLMLLGAWCAHAGVLRHPRRHIAFWKRVLICSLIAGLPFNVAFAWAAWQTAHNPWGAHSLWQSFPGGFVPAFASAYVAALALCAQRPIAGWLVALFAPAGRYALTHYLTQSLLMFILLGGTGFGLGAVLRQGELLALALAIFLAQLAMSHAMLRMDIEGPAERLWRRYTVRMG